MNHITPEQAETLATNEEQDSLHRILGALAVAHLSGEENPTVERIAEIAQISVSEAEHGLRVALAKGFVGQEEK